MIRRKNLEETRKERFEAYKAESNRNASTGCISILIAIGLVLASLKWIYPLCAKYLVELFRNAGANI
jgi:hypothetical protein